MSLTAIGWTASLLQQPVTLARGLRVDGAVLLPASTHPPGTILPGFSFNGWLGCEKLTRACKHCYAEAWSRRVGYTAEGKHRLAIWGRAETTKRVRTSAANWKRPLAWNRVAEQLGTRLKVFAYSLADVGEDHPLVDDWRGDLFELIDKTQWLDWLLLTKRPGHLRDRWPRRWNKYTPKNVWVGATVEDQACAEARIADVVEINAAEHFISVEPMVGAVDLDRVTGTWETNVGDFARRVWDCPHCCGSGYFQVDPYSIACSHCALGPDAIKGTGKGLSWIIAGGESGGGQETLDLAGLEALHAQAERARVPFFCKQDSGQHPGRQGRIPDAIWQTKQFPQRREVHHVG